MSYGVIKLNKIPRLKRKYKEGVNMLAQKKIIETNTVAKKQEVLAVLQLINQKQDNQ